MIAVKYTSDLNKVQRIRSTRSVKAVLDVKYASDLDDVQMLHLAMSHFSCFGSLRESFPTHPAESEAASTCKAPLTTSTNLKCCAEMTACFANFQFTDLNQNAYQPISDCVSWGTN